MTSQNKQKEEAMDNPENNYWKLKFESVKDALIENNFSVWIAENREQAKSIVIDSIIPETGAKLISWGGSMTFKDSGLYDALKDGALMNVIDTFDKNVSKEESLERRRQALLVDLFITGTNAVSETGKLINLDMIGNRVGAITFGPKHVVIMAGRNKIVSDIEDGMIRIKDYAAPVNTMRLEKKTPCYQTGFCEDCKSPDRICNSWTITEKSFPKGRIKVILINEDMGF